MSFHVFGGNVQPIVSGRSRKVGNAPKAHQDYFYLYIYSSETLIMLKMTV